MNREDDIYLIRYSGFTGRADLLKESRYAVDDNPSITELIAHVDLLTKTVEALLRTLGNMSTKGEL